MLLLLPILACLCSAGFFLVLGRPRFVPRADGKAGNAAISIIIPARNEEGNIEGLLESISGQDLLPREVIVVDDASTDRTAEVAERGGAWVVAAAPLPEGWKGKPWACQQGADASEGDWLLFLDADTRLLPHAMGKIVALTVDTEAAHSICPYHVVRKPVEGLSAFFNVLMVAGTGAFAWGANVRDDQGLFGQCLLISREHYKRVEGHARVRGEVLENLHLARHLAAEGIPRRCYLGSGTLRMRMYPGGLAELWSGWKKGFAAGAEAAPGRALLFASLWITGAMFGLVSAVVAFLPGMEGLYRTAAALAYALYVVQCLRAFRLVGSFSFVNALCFPVSLLFYQALFFTALVERKRGIKTRWKGRDVD